MTLNWTNLYSERWSDLLHPSAVAHPAKYNHGLIRKIYDYALEMNYVKAGDKIADPFGGVGLGSFYAAMNGIAWTGCELEPAFHVSGHRNFEKWIDKFWCTCGWEEYLTTLRDWLTSKDEPKPVDDTPQVSMFDLIEPPQLDSAALWSKLIELVQLQRVEAINRRSIEGQFCVGCGKVIAPYPVLLQGDSRFLSSILGQVEAVVSSPPYAESLKPETEDQTRRKQERIAKSKSLYDGRNLEVPSPGKAALGGGYGQSPGQLGSMPAGEYDEVVDMVVSSPAYGSGEKGHPSLGSVNQDNWGNEGTNIAGRRGKDGKYGNSDSQLANLPDTGYDAVISSSPFVSSLGSDNPDKRGGLFRDDKRRNDANLTGTYGDGEANLGTMAEGEFDAIIGSPPFVSSLQSTDKNFIASVDAKYNQKTHNIGDDYGQSDGQLGSLPDKDYDLVIGSPSWAGNSGGQGNASRNAIDPGLFDRHQGGMKRGTGDGEPGNIDHMSEGEYSAVVSSPPYENTNMDMSNGLVGTNVNNGQYGQSTYGQTEGQLGGKQNNPITFWAASKDILLETHKVLRKGGYTFWVVKRYIKAGKVIDFPDMWKRLCEVCGFEHVETIHAWQTEDKGTNFDFEGEKQTKTIKRASFFRLLYEKKYPENAIDFEVVLVLRKL